MKTMRARGLVVLWGAWVAVSAVLISNRHAPRVQVERLAAKPLALVVRAPGNLEPARSVTIKSPFEGPVLRKTFREGQPVKKGDLLIELDRKKIRLSYQAKKDALENARAELARAVRSLKINQVLYKREAIAYSTVEEAERAKVKAQQGLRAAEEDFRLEAERWQASRQVADFDGTIVKDGIGDAPEAVAGQELYTLADVSSYTVKARVDELDIKQVKEGQTAEVRIPIFPDRVFTASVLQVGSAPETAGQPTIPVSLRLSVPEDLVLRPRLSADVRIRTGESAAMISVPLAALGAREEGMVVWTLGAMNRLRARPVQTGRSNPDRIEIVSGLKAGESVVTVSEPEFRSGLRVRVGTPRVRPPLTPVKASAEERSAGFPGRPGARRIKDGKPF